MNPWGTTYNDDAGRPHMSEREAHLANFSDAHGQFTDHETGKVYTSERAMEAERWDRHHRGW